MFAGSRHNLDQGKEEALPHGALRKVRRSI
jgi:hypothetical protein